MSIIMKAVGGQSDQSKPKLKLPSFSQLVSDFVDQGEPKQLTPQEVPQGVVLTPTVTATPSSGRTIVQQRLNSQQQHQLQRPGHDLSLSAPYQPNVGPTMAVPEYRQPRREEQPPPRDYLFPPRTSLPIPHHQHQQNLSLTPNSALHHHHDHRRSMGGSVDFGQPFQSPIEGVFATPRQFISHVPAPSFQAFPPDASFRPQHHRKTSSLTSVDSLTQQQESSRSRLESDQRRQYQTEIELLNRIERMLYSTVNVVRLLGDIKQDLTRHLADSGNFDGELIKLTYQYGETESFISGESLRRFLHNVPAQLLTGAADQIQDSNLTLREWAKVRNLQQQLALAHQGPKGVTAEGTQRPPGRASVTEIGKKKRKNQKRKTDEESTSPVGSSKRKSSTGPGIRPGQKAKSEQWLVSTPDTIPKAVRKESIFIAMEPNIGGSGSSSGGGGGGEGGGGVRSRGGSTAKLPTIGSHRTDQSLIKVRSSELGFNEELSVAKKMSCVQCGETKTPEWRRGPYGIRTLCNACGLFHGKLVKRVGVEQAAVVMAQRRKRGQGMDRRIPNDEDLVGGTIEGDTNPPPTSTG